jgi:threonyl-tRNA synthetase
MQINQELNKLASILLAKSIIDIYPSTILGESSINEDGFNYSFSLDTPISIKELPKILKQMRKNIDRGYKLTYEFISYAKAKELFVNQKYHLELIHGQEKVAIVKFGDDFFDLCEELNIEKLSQIKSIELMNVAGVY